MTEPLAAARMAVDYWKLLRAFDRAAARLPPEHRSKALAQLHYSAERLASHLRDAGLSLVTFEGQSFTANMPAAAINADDFAAEADLVVCDTIEPTVVQGVQVVLMGKVILAKEGEERVSRN
jgi:hypothetical protein